MSEPLEIFLGKSGTTPCVFHPAMANRHGLIAGATGTGKTVTLQLLAEAFVNLGVPVFAADVKGDLSGLAKAATPGSKVQERVAALEIKGYTPQGAPVVFWDVFGERGHPVRTTVSDMGPLLLSRLLDLNEAQEGVLHIAFSVADDQGLLLLDLKDLKALLTWIAEHDDDVRIRYGNVTSTTIGSIQRRLLVLSEAGGESFFGEPALAASAFLRKDLSGKGIVHVLDAKKLINDARLYGTFLLWLLSELFEQLEEVGDQELPRLVFFFDEAHLLFDGAPKVLLQKIEQVVRLIRSKGVGVFFITQSPMDIPENVAAQLGNRFQHALRAFTPRDMRIVDAAAESFRENPSFKTKDVIQELQVGEALISVLDLKGQPTPVERVLLAPPASRIGPVSEDERKELQLRSPFSGIYETAIDRESAYEVLKKQGEHAADRAEAKAAQATPKAPGRTRQTATEAFFTSLLRSAGTSIGRQIIRGVLGSLGGRR